MAQKADSPTLKRAFVPDLVPNTSFRAKKLEKAFADRTCRQAFQTQSPCPSQTLGQRPRSPRSGPPQRPTRFRRPSMPTQASSRTCVPMPTFMSVFGEEVSNTGGQDFTERSTASHGANIGRPASSGNIINGSSSSNVPFTAFHVHRDSTSTLASESSDSSPTTTISTMDSSSVTDPSPGPSPESPIAKVAPSSFVADFRSRKTENNSQDPSQNTFFELQRPTTPAKKPRNLKNLGINTASSLSNLRAANPSAPLPVLAKKEKNTSAPTSPSFIKPPTPPKRRPSNLSLTIQTPGSDNKPMRLIIPPTAAQNRPALRHFQSSPSLPLCSPSVASSGGMQLPSLRPIKTNPHGFAEVPIEMEEEDQEPNFDIPQSREEKPAAYPNGPICIYESGVYLYFEPTAEQATNYDVIINVASEVKNPFTTSGSDSQKDLDARRQDGPPAETVDFDAIPERTKASSFDTQSSSPTTPKATPILEATHTQPTNQQGSNGRVLKTPEYIHIPWEHNTDIVPDLFKLVKVIEDRVQQGKRVLVHCQCGVSRSASLIVAYGLYKNPGISVQEAYDAVKKRSRWIGPNMNLIMQLQEFRNGLLRASRDPAYHNQMYGLNLPKRSGGLPTGISNGANRHSPFDMNASSGARTPRTAPLPPESDVNLQRASTGNMISISPGPLSAPSGVFFSPGFRRSWASSQTHFDLSPKSSPTTSATPYVDPKGHIVPVLSITESDRSSGPAGTKPPEQANPAEQQTNLKPVPNFSRQLPLRKQTDHDNMAEDALSTTSSMSDGFHTASSQPHGFDTLLSPCVPGFNIHSFARDDENAPQLMSPRATEFNLPPWPHGEIDDSYGLLSPRATSFDLESAERVQKPLEPSELSSQHFELTSPTRTQFPTDLFQPNDDMVDVEMTSPRATEFHMTPLKPRVADEDPFGLTSPTRFEFPKNPFAELTPPRNVEPEPRRPSFQAILPPSHLAQPEAFNGFASLNSTAQSHPIIPAPAPVPNITPATPPGRIDSLSTSVEPQSTNLQEPHTPSSKSIERKAPSATTTPERSFLSTPSRQSGIRTRFSSPNMREQRRLHKLQTEMEALLPPRSPHRTADDIDTLMSPRATEFTRNPFHVDLGSSGDDTSPASSTETVKDGQHDREWKDTQQWTPPTALEEDPRSPVQTGSSPIVRNIWDVL
ncbi:hypothetical protein K469DRAFT_722357 [Zopfia rhizophila CBS 207.26]|uniref:protein-tyrosine-phosphatase n=1 Tax=Zopfia rhizophila CBS 207.26 TaxID=1314779 RepID=A0A6A6ES52_9PEZI|nr:hypothetical protein K469DRAFT_722357 [Zopfia rhizophila CBS 207.26]